ncbi:transposase [Ureaplasma urealyticum serovar 10 str. ATCC 33699]|uniref:Transposase n=2 Tax=Ureaplasma urealyticum TaxID=2130 RepID=A0AAX1QYY5_UREUR|nr:EndoU domain-containing protein [Ureaplasma urealyticum]ACI59738.1 transposase [Ureaplasma urealyticum serovar 10 str. ATCC 33699]QDI63833.1 transposase [Ureaplasma urealyticum]RCJ01106.1 transposase [Ureaplasma urealyticum]
MSEFCFVHANEGKFVNANDKNKIRLDTGGHGQANLELLKRLRIGYEINVIFENGVRVGNVKNHKNKDKSENNGQTWLPKSWTEEMILEAGEDVAKSTENQNVPDGVIIYGTYQNVRIGLIKRDNKIVSFFPDSKQDCSVKWVNEKNTMDQSKLKRKKRNKNMKINIQKFKRIIKKRHQADRDIKLYLGRQSIWDTLVAFICKSEASFSGFIEYMKTKMTSYEYIILSEISDDIVAIFPWISFIKAYRFLEQRYPTTTKEYNIKLFIDDAEEYVLSKNN